MDVVRESVIYIYIESERALNSKVMHEYIPFSFPKYCPMDKLILLGATIIPVEYNEITAFNPVGLLNASCKPLKPPQDLP